MNKPGITVIGNNMVDLVSYINQLPKTGETIEAPDFVFDHGGKALYSQDIIRPTDP